MLKRIQTENKIRRENWHTRSNLVNNAVNKYVWIFTVVEEDERERREEKKGKEKKREKEREKIR